MSNSIENFIKELPNSAVNECLFYKIFNVCILNISLYVLNISQYLNTHTVKNIPGIKKIFLSQKLAIYMYSFLQFD